MDNALRFKEVTKTYGNKNALCKIDIEIKKGSIVGLLGPNGSGKSTFLKVACSLLRPTSGEVTVLDEPIGTHLKEAIAFVPEIDYLYGDMTAVEIVDFTAKFFVDFSWKKAHELMASMEVPRHDKIKSLSKGQRARLKLVLAMARKAALVLLDEPLGGIDMISREKIIKLIISAFDQEEQTIIMATHEIKEVETIFDRVIMLKDGKIVLQGNVDDICSERNQSLSQVYQSVYGGE